MQGDELRTRGSPTNIVTGEVLLSKLLLIDNYDSYTMNLAQLIGQVTGTMPDVIMNDTLSWDELQEKLLSLQYLGVVISPGPGTPDKVTGTCY
jgi:anthranilate/para-aminobenzoate synthase component II